MGVPVLAASEGVPWRRRLGLRGALAEPPADSPGSPDPAARQAAMGREGRQTPGTHGLVDVSGFFRSCPGLIT